MFSLMSNKSIALANSEHEDETFQPRVSQFIPLGTTERPLCCLRPVGKPSFARWAAIGGALQLITNPWAAPTLSPVAHSRGLPNKKSRLVAFNKERLP